MRTSRTGDKVRVSNAKTVKDKTARGCLGTMIVPGKRKKMGHLILLADGRLVVIGQSNILVGWRRGEK